MPAKVIDIADIGPVRFVKTERSRSMRLSVNTHGVRVSLPRWTPYVVGIAFVKQHTAWIQSEQSKSNLPLLLNGHKIGKLHTLQFIQIPKHDENRTRVTPTKLLVTHHPSEATTSRDVQLRAEQAATRALKKEATVLLPPRLKALADAHGLAHGTITIKNLKRRWGSCDKQQNITLNLFLMQLSWQQIDYVLCHELAHTKHMNHSAAFWHEVERMLPDARMIAKRVRHIQPALQPVASKDQFDD